MNDLLFTHERHAQATRLFSEYSADYHAGVDERPVYPDLDRKALRELMAAPLPVDGCSLDALFGEFEHVIVPNTTHTANARFLPYVQPSPDSFSAYVDHLAAILNQNCNLWHLSPAANLARGLRQQ